MTPNQIDFYRRLARMLAQQFGPSCEVVVHDLEATDIDHAIVAIENGHVTGRALGGGPSHVVLESLQGRGEGAELKDRPPYFTKTADGKILKSSTLFIRNDEGRPVGILSINYDITLMSAMVSELSAFVQTRANAEQEPEEITRNVADLLEDLLEESVSYVGKPASLMNKEDRVRAIGYLDRRGAFLISKSSERACEFFGISKYSFYTYLNEAKAEHEDASE